MWQQRSIAAAVRAELWAAAAVVLSYGLLVVTLYPTYLRDALPLLNAVYLPARADTRELLLSPHATLLWVTCALAALIGRGSLVRSLAMLPLLASLGFAAALLVQGKGYLNHAYPAVALALFALALTLTEGEHPRRRAGIAALLLLTALSTYVFVAVASYSELARTVGRLAPSNPSIIVAGSNLSVGHPLTRWMEGEWAGRRASLWASGTGVQLLSETADPVRRSLIEGYIAEDRRIFAEDIVARRPDVVLVPGLQGMQWIASSRDVAGAMKPYRTAGAAQGVYVLVRQPRRK
jgi:hypothetical protein